MEKYELNYLLNSSFGEEKGLADAKEITTKALQGEKIIFADSPKRIPLAYPVKNQDEAFLCSIDFETSPEKISLISKSLEKEELVLRFLISKKEELKKNKKEKKIKEKKVNEQESEDNDEQEESKREKPIEKDPSSEESKKKKPAKKDPAELDKELDAILGE